MLRSKHCCEYCKSWDKFSPVFFTIDHIIPPLLGGTHDLQNLAYSCPLCNRLKWKKVNAIDPVILIWRLNQNAAFFSFPTPKSKHGIRLFYTIQSLIFATRNFAMAVIEIKPDTRLERDDMLNGLSITRPQPPTQTPAPPAHSAGRSVPPAHRVAPWSRARFPPGRTAGQSLQKSGTADSIPPWRSR